LADPYSRRRSLADYCQYLKGVGPVRAQRLLKLGIENVNDLLTHFPRKYYDRRNLNKINSLSLDDDVSFLGQVLSVAQRTLRGRKSIITAAVGDDTGIVQVVWFNQPYLMKHLKPGGELIITGELRYFQGARQVVNPEFEVVGDALDQELVHTGRITPVYPLTAGVSQRYLRDLIARALADYLEVIPENLPPAIFQCRHLMSRAEALRGIHFPEDWEHFKQARWRLKLEELFFMQLIFSLQRRTRSHMRSRPRINIDFMLEKKLVESLAFELTGAQLEVLQDIHSDLTSKRGMHRLLQGDVGCGKTIVAAATLLAAVEAGHQAALMVPTEILALQHAQTLSRSFERLAVPVTLLIGSLKAGDKRLVRSQIADGTARVVVGTHALIQEDVSFKALGVVVIDEQHRFGVRQRAALLGKDANPHMLVMTATPIPRTLALTAYADLDLSVIDEMPASRAPVKTRIVTPEKRRAMYDFIRAQLEQGTQAYFLYPVIEETQKQDLEAAASAFEELSQEIFDGVAMGLIHGRMSFAEKEQVMRDFSSGAIKLLVATTVIEVGVHVPEATIMVVHHPERFGLSQLHQLRGRVGRGGKPGYCFLSVVEDSSYQSRQRLKVFTRVTDGFKIAAEDLKIRGPGEFFGLRQHGVPGLKIANPVLDQDIVEIARGQVKGLLDADARLESAEAAPCRRFLEELELDAFGRTIS